MSSLTTHITLPIGSVIQSMLNESQFQDEAGTGWVLMDGRSVAGSLYEAKVGSSTIPDARATVLRMKDNARGLDPHGDEVLGAYQADQFASHAHSASTGGSTRADGGGAGGRSAKFSTNSGGSFDVQWSGGTSIGANGWSETCAKGVVVNFFIRIN